MPHLCLWFAACCMALTALPSSAADAAAGAQRFATPPLAGLLACADCHSDNPQRNNFGNIWSGRNAVALIQRAVSSNTGGMGYFSNFYSSADFANIAAYLGNTPASLAFPLTGSMMVPKDFSSDFLVEGTCSLHRALRCGNRYPNNYWR